MNLDRMTKAELIALIQKQRRQLRIFRNQMDVAGQAINAMSEAIDSMPCSKRYFIGDEGYQAVRRFYGDEEE
jgi:hypothetical protein